ncbi:MAG: hypothetical protein ACK56I_26590 [bacterium]
MNVLLLGAVHHRRRRRRQRRPRVVVTVGAVLGVSHGGLPVDGIKLFCFANDVLGPVL